MWVVQRALTLPSGEEPAANPLFSRASATFE